MLTPRWEEGLAGHEFEHDAPALGRRKVAWVRVPSRRAPAGGFPVCFLLHPFGGDRLSWARQAGDFLAHFGEEWAFVFPESGRRWFMNDVSGRRYEDYLVEDLLPAVQASFPVSCDARRRLVGGFSMGGAGAVHLALRHPALFPRAFAIAGAFFASEREGDPYAALRGGACMMPTQQEHERVWGPPGSEVRRVYDTGRLVEAAAGQGLTLALEVGTEDHPRVVEMNRRMHRLLVTTGMSHTYDECPGDHGWDYAARAAPRVLGRLLASGG
ncbi:esterase family protein [Myxococcus sp. K15C18031901]|uniref:alpha/beta hydrolase n=1 Tax=Myxococcus dinghuensis TaxID=2906761 RepID=UPI0020A728E8|nr:alpha/beta hydrolase-fold protein [Myxococcus dinghuensis]MCP3097326.1 esterase family protein [Myxococcus dinghuensis]